MSEEKKYQGIRAGDAWIAGGPITMTEAEALIEDHMKGASVDVNFWLEEEADHLVASFLDRDEPVSASSPGNNKFTKDQTWRPVRDIRSNKRR
jgi:hypothetical protein